MAEEEGKKEEEKLEFTPEGETLGGFPLPRAGSRHYFRRPGADSLVVVRVHGNRTLPLGACRSILRQAQLTPGDLAQLLRG